MESKEQVESIRKLFNLMQNSLKLKFEELKFTNIYTSFEIFKMHVENLDQWLDENILGKLALAVFRELFEDKNYFKEYNEKKFEYIKILINSIYSKGKSKAGAILDNKIVEILGEVKNQLLRKLIKILKYNEFEKEIYYLLLVLLQLRNFQIIDLVFYLKEIIQNKYPESLFDFEGADEVTFNEFLEKFCLIFEEKKIENYMVIQWNKKERNIFVKNKSLDEIEDIILSTTEKKKQNNKIIKKKKIAESELGQSEDTFKKGNAINSENVENIVKIEKAKESIDFPSNQEKGIIGQNVVQKNEELNKDISSKVVGQNSSKKSADVKNSNEYKLEENGITSKKDNEKKDGFYVMGNNNNETKELDVIEGKHIFTNNDVQNIEELKKSINDIKNKYEEINIKYEQLRNENEKINIKYEQITNENEKIKSENEKIKSENKKIKCENKMLLNKINLNKEKCQYLNSKMLENQKEIYELKFIIKIIGLRSAYKTLIDVFLIIFGITENGSFEEKCKTIIKYIRNYNNQNAFKIAKLFADISNLISQTNIKAHNIEINENIYEEIIKNLSKYTGNTQYLDLLNLIKKLDLENDFDKLVFIRNEKINKKKVEKKEYESKEAEIILKIKNNPKIKDGKGLANILSY